MKVSVPAFAPPTPPETGASIKARSFAAAASATAREVSGAMVEESITRVPAGRAASRPSSPRYTASTCLPAGSMVITHSTPWVAALAESAVLAPSATNVSTAGLDRSKTVTSCPSFSRLEAMGPPMLPRPIKVTFAILLLLVFVAVRRDLSVPGRLAEKCFNPLVVQFRQRGITPSGLHVFVDQQRPDAFGKLSLLQAVHRHHQLVIQHLFQAVALAALQVFPGQGQ